MAIRLSKMQFFICFVFLFILLVFSNRIDFYLNGTFTTGKFAGTIRNNSKTYDKFGHRRGNPKNIIIEFETLDNQYIIRFNEWDDTELGDINNIPIIYNADKPTKAYVYTDFGFWISPMILYLFPLFIISALYHGFIDENRFFTISLFKRKQKVFSTKIMDYNK